MTFEQHPNGREHQQQEDEAEQEPDPAGKAQLIEDRIRRRGQNQERTAGGGPSRDDPAPRADDGALQAHRKRGPATALFAEPNHQVDGEVDAESEHHDPEHGFHDRELPRPQADEGQGGAHREQHRNGDSEQDEARSKRRQVGHMGAPIREVGFGDPIQVQDGLCVSLLGLIRGY